MKQESAINSDAIDKALKTATTQSERLALQRQKDDLADLVRSQFSNAFQKVLQVQADTRERNPSFKGEFGNTTLGTTNEAQSLLISLSSKKSPETTLTLLSYKEGKRYRAPTPKHFNGTMTEFTDMIGEVTIALETGKPSEQLQFVNNLTP